VILLPIALTIAASPAVMILQDTGQQRDGLPVFRQHPDAARYEQVLTSGFSGRLVRLYAIEQRVSHPDREPRPAILCLTQNQGGFPRDGGFVLDGVLRRAPYVDLHERSALTGRYGAIDQIFPHELMHIILRDLAGERADGRASQVHAIGVATDRLTAFDEGLAEHAQAMAIDDPGAASDTHALAGQTDLDASAARNAEAYRRAMTARWAIAPRVRMTFPFWFSGTEQYWRYHAVKANLFAHAAPATGRDAYATYLLDNVLPGTAEDPLKPLSRLLATEGVVSAFFVRLATDPAIQRTLAPPSVYDGFHVTRAAIDPLENAYVKILSAFAGRTHDLVAFTRTYAALFPDDRAAFATVLRDTFGASALAGVPEIWLVNQDTPNGRSLFDQFRGSPRPHAFDLNAASMGDLIGVTGVDVSRAQAILSNAPYRSLADLQRVAGLDPAVRARFKRMGADANVKDARGDEGSMSFKAILMPYARYGAIVVIATAIVAAIVYARVRRVRWWRAALNGLGVALVGLLCGWAMDTGSGLVGWIAPAIAFGLPATAIAAWRTRSWSIAGRVLAAWSFAALVPLLALRPIG